MPRYVKAYQASALQQFVDFPHGTPATGTAIHDSQDGAAADVLYLHSDFTVRTGIYEDAPIVFQDAGPRWREFCTRELGFQVPDWEAEAREVRRRILPGTTEGGPPTDHSP